MNLSVTPSTVGGAWRVLVSAFAFAALACLTAPVQAKPAQPQDRVEADAGFADFVERLWPDARERGVSRQTFDDAFRGVEPDPKVVALTKKQSEFVRPIWDYLDGAVTAKRIENGRELAAQWSETLDKVERSYGVPRSIVLGVWGMETNFGAFSGNLYAVRSLATLAYIRYRGQYFRDELLIALQVLEGDHMEPP